MTHSFTAAAVTYMLDIYKNDYFNEIPQPYVKCKLSGVVVQASQPESRGSPINLHTALKQV